MCVCVCVRPEHMHASRPHRALDVSVPEFHLERTPLLTSPHPPELTGQSLTPLDLTSSIWSACSRAVQQHACCTDTTDGNEWHTNQRSSLFVWLFTYVCWSPSVGRQDKWQGWCLLTTFALDWFLLDILTPLFWDVYFSVCDLIGWPRPPLFLCIDLPSVRLSLHSHPPDSLRTDGGRCRSLARYDAMAL